MAHIIEDRVKETTTSTGTGPFVLGGADVGFVTFSSKCSVGDTFRGTIQAVDALGVPTGDWQTGTFTYSAANQITTLAVEASSTGSAVSFGSGNKQVWLGLTAIQARWAREKLTGNRQYYVRADGSDANTGLANTTGGAFLTIQKAVDLISDTLDLQGYVVTIQVADGTYTTPVVLRKLTGRGTVVIQGNSTTPANVVLSVTSANGVAAGVDASGYTLKDFKVQTTTAGSGVIAQRGALVAVNNLVFGACVTAHLYADSGATIVASGPYAIAGSAASHVQLDSGGRLECNSRTVTISGTPAFSAAFAYLTDTATASIQGNTFSGSATGVRYNVSYNSVLRTGGATLPGGTAGTNTNGGYYI